MRTSPRVCSLVGWLLAAHACAPRAAPSDDGNGPLDAMGSFDGPDARSAPSDDVRLSADTLDGAPHHDVTADAAALDVSADASADVAPRSTARDLLVRLRAEPPHADRQLELSVWSPGAALSSRAILRGYREDDEVTLRGVILDAPARLDWSLDDNASLGYDAPPTDRSASVALSWPRDASSAPHVAVVQGDGPSSDIGPGDAPGGTLTGRFSEFEVHAGVFFQFELTPEGQDRTVALFRDRDLGATGSFTFALRAILQEGSRYTASWFIDLNDNGVYDVRGDHGGSLSFTGRAAGVTLFHEHHANRSWTVE
jgi:hypothetical protein